MKINEEGFSEFLVSNKKTSVSENRGRSNDVTTMGHKNSGPKLGHTIKNLCANLET